MSGEVYKECPGSVQGVSKECPEVSKECPDEVV